MLVDATYRDEFVGELRERMRSTFLVRADYLRLRADGGRRAGRYRPSRRGIRVEPDAPVSAADSSDGGSPVRNGA